METRIITIISILALNAGITFANSDISFSESRTTERSLISLAPVSPAEAEFSDLVPEADAPVALLMPVTPKEATFEEDSFCTDQDNALLSILSPTTPAEADFEEII
jgi:hypothetical protein